ncbi:MAG TPA: hydrogenase accessory protein HypB [Bacteroidetes bacterium]|nr:hydrogenase accessory protein HypB [Bacteroidota bacterium]
MCDTCGCGEPGNGFLITRMNRDGSHEHLPGDGHAEGHSHAHSHSHSHEHGHGHEHEHHQHHGEMPHVHTPDAEKKIELEMDVLSKNNLLAERNRGYFEGKGLLALNWVSSPGSGKTSILERLVEALGKEMNFYLIEGDQQSLLDAERINKTGVPVVQVNTGSGCHLDAAMVQQAVRSLDPSGPGILMIENVGNLVCPALFDLGEHFRVLVASVTEGDDKPLKYPDMFRTSQVCLINKIDLLPYLDTDVKVLKGNALRVNSSLEIFDMSARTGEGMESFYEWLRGKMKK